MNNIKWTDEQTAFLIVRRSEGMKMPEICEKLNSKFNINYETKQLVSKMGNLNTRKKNTKVTARRKANSITKSLITKKGKKPAKYMKYTQDKVDFVYACVGNNFPNNMTINGFKEQFNASLTARQIDYIIQSKRPSSFTSSPEEEVTEVIISEVVEETSPLEEITEVIISEVIGETTSEEVTELRNQSRTRHHWSEQEERTLLLTFYELSIDEVRNKFQRPFYAIARRLEMIVDSTEPKYITMLMEATKIITERKKAAASTGFLKSRRLRKQAKKASKRQAKLDREINRAELKLKKLRGEE